MCATIKKIFYTKVKNNNKTKEMRKIMKKYQNINHTFEPVYNQDSSVLILGTFPSVKSREEAFYYGHPRNRFWKVIAAVTKAIEPIDVKEKKALLLKNHIAIWDVIASCDIVGSSDSSIKNVIPADVKKILEESNIKRIYANGGTAKKLYDKYLLESIGIEIYGLPSTSPANASYGLESLIKLWEVIVPYL